MRGDDIAAHPLQLGHAGVGCCVPDADAPRRRVHDVGEQNGPVAGRLSVFNR